jgi:glyoxylase I family protein
MFFYSPRRIELISGLLGMRYSSAFFALPCVKEAVIKIREIDHIVLRVIDLDRMLRFYCDALGCTVERRQDEIGLVQLRAGDSLVDLVQVDGKLGRMGGAAPGKEARNMDHLCFRVEPFDEPGIRRHLAAHSVEAGQTESRYGAEGEGPSIYIADPEGNVVELKGPPDA